MPKPKQPRDYMVFRDGTVLYNNAAGHWKEKRLTKSNKGYLRTRVHSKLTPVHRLVAEKYIPNPENLPHVNHKDGNKLNNNVENLEWVSNKNNAYHAMSIGKHSNPAVPIVGIHTATGEGLFLRSHTEAAHYGLTRENIGKCLRGERASANGYEWRLFNE